LKQGDVVVAAGTQFMAENLKVKLSSDTQQSASAEDDVATTSSLR
ncbi:efflux RND transporter periplasmic adaptor subunit, partial [Mesorhizobium sp. M2E.F.Ca.ET.166.01.1.1]